MINVIDKNVKNKIAIFVHHMEQSMNDENIKL